MFINPNRQAKTHVQSNLNEYSGTIYQTKNISFDSGYISLAERSYAQTTTDDDADLVNADAILASNSNIYVNSHEVFVGTMRFDSNFSDISGHTNRPTPSVEEDVVYFNGTEVVSDGTSIYYRSASTTWTKVSISGAPFSTSNPTCMAVFHSANQLAVGNSNCVKFINTSWSVSATVLTLPNEYQVSSLVSSGNQLFIFTRSTYGGEARLFIVNGIKTTHDYSYGIGTFEVFSGVSFKSSVVGIDALGRIMRFSGGGFEMLAALPIFVSKEEWADSQNDYSKVSNRGLSVDGDLLFINVSSQVQHISKYNLPNFPSGVWCYDSATGSLYQRYSPTYTRIQTISGLSVTVNATNNTFTLTSGNLNSVVTGMPVVYDYVSGSAIPELKNSTQYFIIKTSSTVFKLATTYANALAGTAIDITDVGTISQKFYVFLENDYGWSYYDNRSTVASLNNTLFNSDETGRVVMTANLFAKQSQSTNKTVICGITPILNNRGYYIQQRVFSENVTDSFPGISLKFKPLGAEDKIIIKYKVLDKYGIPFSSLVGNSSNWIATWTDTDTFTTTADMSLASVGDEIEIIAGVGAGVLSHISSLSYNAGTWTVNLTEGYPFAVSGDVFYFNVDNWTYFDSIDNSNTSNYYVKSLGVNGKFIAIKVELRGVGTMIEESIIQNHSKISVSL